MNLRQITDRLNRQGYSRDEIEDITDRIANAGDDQQPLRFAATLGANDGKFRTGEADGVQGQAGEKAP